MRCYAHQMLRAETMQTRNKRAMRTTANKQTLTHKSVYKAKINHNSNLRFTSKAHI